MCLLLSLSVLTNFASQTVSYETKLKDSYKCWVEASRLDFIFKRSCYVIPIVNLIKQFVTLHSSIFAHVQLHEESLKRVKSHEEVHFLADEFSKVLMKIPRFEGLKPRAAALQQLRCLAQGVLTVSWFSAMRNLLRKKFLITRINASILWELEIRSDFARPYWDMFTAGRIQAGKKAKIV